MITASRLAQIMDNFIMLVCKVIPKITTYEYTGDDEE
jgi:hypothetical protein